MKKYVYALIRKEGRILMLKRPKKKKTYGAYWNFPGGRNEDGETEIQTVIREVKEETGINFKPLTKIMDIIDKDAELIQVGRFPWRLVNERRVQMR